MNPHDRFGFQWKPLLAGTWEVENNLTEGDFTGLLVNFVNAVGFALEKLGVAPLRLRTPPFPDFSYVVARTDESVVIVLGRAPTYSLRYAYYYDVRQLNQNVTTTAALEQLSSDMPWDDMLTASFPPNILWLPAEQRDALVGAQAQQVAEELVSRVKVTSQPQEVEIQPISIFPPGPFKRNDKLCFVLMPFKPELRDVYDLAIKPAVEAEGLECRRADDIMASGDVLAQLYESLREARLIIADLTDTNGNVLYELGLAHMMGHRVILLTQDMHQVPFDLRQQRHIVYKQAMGGAEALKRDLQAHLRAALTS